MVIPFLYSNRENSTPITPENPVAANSESQIQQDNTDPSRQGLI